MLLPADTIAKPALMVENLGRLDTHNESLIVVLPRAEWPSTFISFGKGGQ
jgi:hypothetical protein